MRSWMRGPEVDTQEIMSGLGTSRLAQTSLFERGSDFDGACWHAKKPLPLRIVEQEEVFDDLWVPTQTKKAASFWITN